MPLSQPGDRPPWMGGLPHGKRSSPGIPVLRSGRRDNLQFYEEPVTLKWSRRRRALPTPGRLEDVGFPESVRT